MFLFFWIGFSIFFVVSGIVFGILLCRCRKKYGKENALYKEYQKGMVISFALFIVCFISSLIFAFILEEKDRVWMGVDILLFISGIVFGILLYRCGKKYGKENALYKKYLKGMVISFALFGLCLLGLLLFPILGIIFNLLSFYYKEKYGAENILCKRCRKMYLIFMGIFVFCVITHFLFTFVIKDIRKVLIGFSVLFVILGIIFAILLHRSVEKYGVGNIFYLKYQKGMGISFLLFVVCLLGSMFFPFTLKKDTSVLEEYAAVLKNEDDQEDSEPEEYELEEKKQTGFSDDKKEFEKEDTDIFGEGKETEKVTDIFKGHDESEKEELTQSQKDEKEKRKQELEEFKTNLVENSDGAVISIEEYTEGIFHITVSNAWYLLSENEKKYFAEEMNSQFAMYATYVYDMDYVYLTIYNESGRRVAESKLFGGMEIKE